MKTGITLTAMFILVAVSTMSGAADNRIKSTSTASGYENEQLLFLENWMFHDCYWKFLDSNCLRREFDQPVFLESWMTDPFYWSCPRKENRNYDCGLPEELEGLIYLDLWKTDDHTWSNEYSEVIFKPEKK